MGIVNYGKEFCLRLANARVTEAALFAANKENEELAVEIKRLNQELDQFAYIISHDLKAPVRNISSFMKLLSNRFSTTLPPDGKEFIHMAQICSDRLGQQIDDMLSYCRVNRNLPPAADIDLNEVVRTISMELSAKLNEANAEIIVEKGLPLLKDAHSSMIYQVMQNLVANGIKFNNNPNPVVVIDYKEEADRVCFSVNDNGIGIPKGFEGKLFQMFKRLHTQDQFEGTGIGLALCKKIVTFYKGEIWYESGKGTGTTFYFTLPKHMVGHAMPKLPGLTIQVNLVSKAA